MKKKSQAYWKDFLSDRIERGQLSIVGYIAKVGYDEYFITDQFATASWNDKRLIDNSVTETKRFVVGFIGWRVIRGRETKMIRRGNPAVSYLKFQPQIMTFTLEDIKYIMQCGTNHECGNVANIDELEYGSRIRNTAYVKHFRYGIENIDDFMKFVDMRPQAHQLHIDKKIEEFNNRPCSR